MFDWITGMLMALHYTCDENDAIKLHEISFMIAGIFDWRTYRHGTIEIYVQNLRARKGDVNNEEDTGIGKQKWKDNEYMR